MNKRKLHITKSAVIEVITKNADKIKTSSLLALVNENKEIKKVLAENDALTGGDEPTADAEPQADSPSGLEGMIGGDEDRAIQYPENPGIETPSIDGEKPSEFEGGLPTPDGQAMAQKLSKQAPSQLLDYLEKLEEAKSILSKVAAGESDQEVKNKIYSHYEKVQKTAFEMIKEFGIVH